jgi:acyl-CoA thioesterase-1
MAWFMFKRLLWLVLLCGWSVTAAAAPKILILGDSLSSAYGIPVQTGWTALLQERLRAQGYPHEVVNASISGETTAGGLARLPPLLRDHKPQFVLLELGANDGLRGLPLKTMRANLKEMIALSEKAGATPVLFEMRIPANYGKKYVDAFYASFADLAEAEDVALVPFFLAPVAMSRKMTLKDGIHPNAEAQPLLLDAVWPTLQGTLGRPAAVPVGSRN